MIWIKRLGWFLGAVVALLVLALIGVYVVTSIRMNKRYDVAARPISVPSDSAGIARGRHIVVAIAECAGCHGDDLGGQQLSNDFVFGRLAAPNLTPGQGGLGTRYDDPTLARAIRHGLNPDGKPLLLMPSETFQYLSDDDVGAVVGYIRSLPPVDKTWPTSRVGPLARVLSVLMTHFPLIPARVVDHEREQPRSAPEDSTPAYGKYLVDLGGCTGCHGPGLSGGAMGPGKPAANLTPAGIGTWTEADFVRALRQGIRPGGTPIDSAMPWPRAGKMTDSEIHAVWLFLKSVPAKEFGNH